LNPIVARWISTNHLEEVFQIDVLILDEAISTSKNGFHQNKYNHHAINLARSFLSNRERHL
jgi:hypothetical protein